jgi:hypothetical protein
MTVRDFNPFPLTSPDSVGGVSVERISARPRHSRISAPVLAAILAMGMTLLQVFPAGAGEVLEIPQAVTTPPVAAVHPHRSRTHKVHANHRAQDSYDGSSATPASDADWTAVTPSDATAAPDSPPPPTKVAANTESYPPDPNVGSISDYQNQPGENGQPPTFAMGSGGGGRSEPQGSMTSNLIIGGILVGMMALEIASSHHRR